MFHGWMFDPEGAHAAEDNTLQNLIRHRLVCESAHRPPARDRLVNVHARLPSICRSGLLNPASPSLETREPLKVRSPWGTTTSGLVRMSSASSIRSGGQGAVTTEVGHDER